MVVAIKIDYLVDHLADYPQSMARLADDFRQEWPGWYGEYGPGDAVQDLRGYANKGRIPMGLVALRDDVACGFAALKAQAITGYEHLQPWVGAGYVRPELRRQGIGALLLAALEHEARALGHARLYCGTATSASLLLRAGWQPLAEAMQGNERVTIYEKTL